MSGETGQFESGWQIDTLREHFTRLHAEADRRYEQRFEAQERALQIALDAVNREFHEHLLQVERETQAAFQASEKAITKAEVATEKRFEGVNEFRDALRDAAANNIARVEAESRFKALDDKVDGILAELAENRGNSVGRASLFAGLGVIITVVLAAAGLILAFNQ